METRRLVALAATTLFLGGCFQSTALVKVNADGTGTIEHRTTMSAAAVAQLRQFAGAFGQAGGKPIDPFSEEDARTFAAQMGEGVTLVSSTPIKTAGAEGRTNVYQFRDIRKLRFSEMPKMPGKTDGRVRAGGIALGGNGSGAVTFDLTRTAEANALLTLHVAGEAVDTILKAGGTDRGTPIRSDQIATLRQMLAGMRVAVQIEPSGRLVRTSSPYVDGQTVTLFDLDIDEMLKDETILTRLQNARTADDLAAAMKGAPGLRMSLERDVTIEFTPTR
jgi:hypothetical protein